MEPDARKDGRGGGVEEEIGGWKGKRKRLHRRTSEKQLETIVYTLSSLLIEEVNENEGATSCAPAARKEKRERGNASRASFYMRLGLSGYYEIRKWERKVWK
jgi:hypothetical protein